MVQTDKRELLLFWVCHRYRKPLRDQLITKKDFHPHGSPVRAQHGLCEAKLHRDSAGKGRKALKGAAQCVGQVRDTWGAPCRQRL